MRILSSDENVLFIFEILPNLSCVDVSQVQCLMGIWRFDNFENEDISNQWPLLLTSTDVNLNMDKYLRP